jgi:hypothetical protein
MINVGDYFNFVALNQVFEMEAVSRGSIPPSDDNLRSLLAGTSVLASTLDNNFLDIPYKAPNNLFCLTVPFFDKQRVARGDKDKSVSILKVQTRDGVTVDLVYTSSTGMWRKTTSTFTLRSSTSHKLKEYLVFKQVGDRVTDVSPLFVENVARLTTMVNKF